MNIVSIKCWILVNKNAPALFSFSFLHLSHTHVFLLLVFVKKWKNNNGISYIIYRWWAYILFTTSSKISIIVTWNKKQTTNIHTQTETTSERARESSIEKKGTRWKLNSKIQRATETSSTMRIIIIMEKLIARARRSVKIYHSVSISEWVGAFLRVRKNDNVKTKAGNDSVEKELGYNETILNTKPQFLTHNYCPYPIL